MVFVLLRDIAIVHQGYIMELFARMVCIPPIIQSIYQPINPLSIIAHILRLFGQLYVILPAKMVETVPLLEYVAVQVGSSMDLVAKIVRYIRSNTYEHKIRYLLQ